jgi:DNA-binding CsgD family transcriptional regulator
MDVILISEDYFLAHGLIALMPNVQWCRTTHERFSCVEANSSGVIFIDDRLNPLDIYSFLPNAGLNNYLIMLQVSNDSSCHHFFPYCESVVEMSLKPVRLVQRLSHCLRAARSNMPRRKVRSLITPMEELVMSHLFAGLSITDVAKKIGLTEKSIYKHRVHVVRKLGFASYSHFYHALASALCLRTEASSDVS